MNGKQTNEPCRGDRFLRRRPLPRSLSLGWRIRGSFRCSGKSFPDKKNNEEKINDERTYQIMKKKVGIKAKHFHGRKKSNYKKCLPSVQLNIINDDFTGSGWASQDILSNLLKTIGEVKSCLVRSCR